MAKTLELILGLGLVGVGGYLFVTKLWPMIEEGFPSASAGAEEEEEEERRMPVAMIEDRYPDYIIEDRYPDYLYTTPPPVYYYQQPYPSYPSCPNGRYWDGYRCKKVDCPPGMKLDEDIGICEPKCPAGFYFKSSAGRCVFLSEPCDSDEYWDWSRMKCREKRRRDGGGDGSRDRGRHRRGKRPERRWGDNSRDRWHQDRDREDSIKAAIAPEKVQEKTESDKVKEIAEKAVQSFIEVDF